MKQLPKHKIDPWRFIETVQDRTNAWIAVEPYPLQIMCSITASCHRISSYAALSQYFEKQL